jgi:putative FmdB family regulatory protein
MPTYVYRRTDGSTFEVEQRMTDEPLHSDPQSGEPVQRVLFAPAVHFKGKGFHNTDYPTRSRRPRPAGWQPGARCATTGAPAPAACPGGCACH